MSEKMAPAASGRRMRMTMEKNPCDLCKREGCEYDCALHGDHKNFQCTEYDCFLNYEGNCLIGLYERCGAWKE